MFFGVDIDILRVRCQTCQATERSLADLRQQLELQTRDMALPTNIRKTSSPEALGPDELALIGAAPAALAIRSHGRSLFFSVPFKGFLHTVESTLRKSSDVEMRYSIILINILNSNVWRVRDVLKHKSHESGSLKIYHIYIYIPSEF